MYRTYARLNPYRIIPPIGSSMCFFENFNQDVLQALITIREMENSLQDTMLESSTQDFCGAKTFRGPQHGFSSRKITHPSKQSEDKRLVYSDENIDIELQYLEMRDRSYSFSDDDQAEDDDYKAYVLGITAGKESDQLQELEDENESDEDDELAQEEETDPDVFEGMMSKMSLWCNTSGQDTDTDDHVFSSHGSDPSLMMTRSTQVLRIRSK